MYIRIAFSEILAGWLRLAEVIRGINGGPRQQPGLNRNLIHLRRSIFYGQVPHIGFGSVQLGVKSPKSLGSEVILVTHHSDRS